MRTSFAVNDMTIHRIVEQESGFTPMLDFLPTLSKETLGENLDWLSPGGYDSASGNVVLCFQSYVVKTPHHNILVDSCMAPNAVTRQPDVGATRRIVTTSLGRAYLAGMESADREKLMAEIRAAGDVEWASFKRDMDREIKRYQAHGFCIAKDTAV